MEWLGIALWALVVALALPLSAAGALTAPSLGTQALLALAGLALAVLYVALGGGRWLAWVSGGLALAAAFALLGGLRVLLSDTPRSSSAGQDAEEHAAALAGVLWPLELTTAFAMLLAAGGVTTIG